MILLIKLTNCLAINYCKYYQEVLYTQHNFMQNSHILSAPRDVLISHDPEIKTNLYKHASVIPRRLP